MEVLGGKTDLLSGIISGGSFFKPKSVITLPNGQTINSTGDSFRDLTISKFGLPPDVGQGDNFTDATTGAKVENSNTGSISSVISFVESLVGRAAIIILGFIFVAVGLSMFKNPNATIVKVANNAADTAIKTAKGAV